MHDMNIEQSILILAVSLSVPLAAADDCTAILEQGIRNTYQLSSGSDFQSNMKSSFCDKSLNRLHDKSSGGFSLGVTIEGFPLSMGAQNSEQSANDLKKELCSDGSSSMNDKKYERLLQTFADKNVVDAWSLCKKTDGGLILEGDAHDDSLTLRLRFRNVGSVHETTLTAPTQVIGASCPSMQWNTGTKVTGSEQMIYCQRFADQAVTVLVNSDFNGARFYLPKPAKFEVVKSSPVHETATEGFRNCYLIATNPTLAACPADQSLSEGASCSCGPPAFPVPQMGTVKISKPSLPGEGALPLPGGSMGIPGAGGVLPAPK